MLDAVSHTDFQPRETGYVSKCDLCYDVRRHQHQHAPANELRPAAYYENGDAQTAATC